MVLCRRVSPCTLRATVALECALWQGVIVRLDVHLDSPKIAELAFGAIVKQWGECVQCKDIGVVRLPISLESWIATGGNRSQPRTLTLW